MRGSRSKNKAFTLLAVIFLTVFLAILGMASFSQAFTYQQNVRVREASTEVLYVAQTAADQMVEEAHTGSNWTPPLNPNGTPTFQLPVAVYGAAGSPANVPVGTTGRYQVQLREQRNASIAGAQWIMLYFRITATSNVETPGGAVSKVMDVVVKAQSPMFFFMTTLSDFSLMPGADIDGSVMAPSIEVFNDPSDPLHVTGGLSYINNIRINGATAGSVLVDSSTFTDNDGYNPAGSGIDIEGAIAPQNNVTFVSIDLTDPNNRYRQLANGGGRVFLATLDVAGGNITRNTDLQGANSKAPNGIVYSTENIRIGNASFAQSMTFVTEKDIVISGDITATNAHVGLFAGGDILIESNPDTRNLDLIGIFGLANGVMRTLPIPAGSTNSYNNLTIIGSLALRGQNSASSAMVLNDYTNRDYNEDPAPYVDPVPGMPYMADIVEWSLDGTPAI